MQREEAKLNEELFITAFDAARIARNFGLEPLSFLSFYLGTDTKFPLFKIKGKSFILGLDEEAFKEEYLSNVKQSARELNEYSRIVELWNRNFGEQGSFIEFLYFIIKRVDQ